MSADLPTFATQYRCERELGRGGFGIVYLGTDLRLDRLVAIKVVRDVDASEAVRARFRQEARILASLEHPHIVPIHAFGEEDDALYFVMKHVDGPQLDPRVHGAGRGLTSVLDTMEPLASALDYAHARGVVHRDLKPANVRFTADGRPVLLDFGIAISDDHGQRLTAEGASLGTPHYMSPEQAQALTVGPRSDQYSLAVMLYELVAGEPPFHGGQPLSVMFRQISEAPRLLSDQNPDVPVAFARALMVALEKEPASRYPSCVAMVQALRPFVGSATRLYGPGANLTDIHALAETGALPVARATDPEITHEPPTAQATDPDIGAPDTPEPAADTAPTPPNEPSSLDRPTQPEAPRAPTPTRRGAAPLLAMGALLLVAAAGGGWWATKGSSAAPPAGSAPAAVAPRADAAPPPSPVPEAAPGAAPVADPVAGDAAPSSPAPDAAAPTPQRRKPRARIRM